MTKNSIKFLILALAAAAVISTPAAAENSRNHTNVAAATKVARNDLLHRGTNLVPAGPLCFGDVYLV